MGHHRAAMHQVEGRQPTTARCRSPLTPTTQSVWCVGKGRSAGVRTVDADVRSVTCAQWSTSRADASRGRVTCVAQRRTCTGAGAESSCVRITVTTRARKPGRSASDCNKVATAVRSVRKSGPRGVRGARFGFARHTLDMSALLHLLTDGRRHGRRLRRRAERQRLNTERPLSKASQGWRRKRQVRMRILLVGPTSPKRSWPRST